MTVKELIEELQKLPPDAKEKRIVSMAEGRIWDVSTVEVFDEFVLL